MKKYRLTNSLYILILLIFIILIAGCDTSAPSQDLTSAPTISSTSSLAPAPTATSALSPTSAPTPTPTVQDTEVVQFSHEAGIYDKAFVLTLTAKEGYTLYYTTDTTDPRTAKNALYTTAGILIAPQNKMGTMSKTLASLFGYSLSTADILSGVVVKVSARNNATGQWSKVYTNTYYAANDLAEKYNLPFISITVNNDEFSTRNGIYYTTMQHPFDTKERILAYCEFFDRNGMLADELYAQLCLSGNGSLGNLQKSLRLYFKKDLVADDTDSPSKLKYDIFEGRALDINGYAINEYKRLLLRNSGNDATSTLLRDMLMQRLSKGLNMPVMEGQPVMLFINGEFWGMYNARERYDTKYFEYHYGILEENFVMLEAPTPLVTGNANSPYELNDGVTGDEKPWNDLVSYINSHDLSNATYYNYVAQRLDISNIIDYFTSCLFFCNTDWPGNNIKVWRNKNENDPSGYDTKWRFALLDMDMGLGLATDVSHNMMSTINADTIASNIFRALLKNKDFKETFIARFKEIVQNYYNTDISLPLLNSMAAEIDQAIRLNCQRWSAAGNTYSNWLNQIEKVRNFLTNRAAYAIEDLNEYFGIYPSESTFVFDSTQCTVTVDGERIESGSIYEYNGSKQITVTVSALSGCTYKGTVVTNVYGSQKVYTQASNKFTITDKTTISIVTSKNALSQDAFLTSGSYSLFYVNSNGDLYSWGNNTYSQLGIATNDIITSPMFILSGVTCLATSHGGSTGDMPHTLILTSDNKLYTIGNNSFGQLGRGGNTKSLSLADVPQGKIISVSAGFDHSLILMENGDLYGVGNNAYGQLGTYNFGGAVTSFRLIARNVVTMAAGRRHTLYITSDSKLYGLGDNRWNKLSTSSTDRFSTPRLLADNAKYVYAGQHSSLYIDNNDVLYYFGNLGLAGNLEHVNGVFYKLLDNVKKADIVDGHALILTNNADVYAWGENSYGQSLLKSTQAQTLPVKISSDAADIAPGAGFSSILYNDGSVSSWGMNTYGITGNGVRSDVARNPIKLSPSSAFSKIPAN